MSIAKLEEAIGQLIDETILKVNDPSSIDTANAEFALVYLREMTISHKMDKLSDEITSTLRKASILRAFHRDTILKQLIDKLVFDYGSKVLVETGSFLAHSSEYIAWKYKHLRVISIELEPSYYELAKRRLSIYENSQVIHGSSDSVLESMLKDTNFRDSISSRLPIFFLDAHWYDYLPVAREIELILASNVECIIIVDDFKVPGHDVFGFDNYGPGKSIDLDLIFPVINRFGHCKVYLPSYAEDPDLLLCDFIRGKCIIVCDVKNSGKASKLATSKFFKRNFNEIEVSFSVIHQF